MRLIAAFLAMLPGLADAAACITRSGPQTTPLIELYTSEGCSSCPPADRWLSRFVAGGTQRAIPLAFHVTYWDYIGWRDPFADERHTQRQRNVASAAGARYVYTPQVIVGGRDFRAWSTERALEDALAAIQRRPARASLAIQLEPGSGITGRITATVAPGVKARDLVLVGAVTQDRLASRVTAGENRGEELRHDAVVRDIATGPAVEPLALRFPSRAGWDASRMSVVAFLQDRKTGEVLQALSAPACR